MYKISIDRHIGTDGAIALAEMLKVNKSLVDLELYLDKSLGHDGAHALINALQHNHTLEELKLPECYRNCFSPEELGGMDSRVKWGY